VWGVGIVVVSLGLGAAGCRKVEAKVPAAPVAMALETPEPPSRLVIPVSAEPPPAPDKPAPTSPTRPPTRPPVTGGPPNPPPDPTPPPVLKTGSSLAELEARATERLDRAQRDIARVSPGSLTPNARDQYDSAMRFIRMAKDAILTKNFVYAAYCADKAATLAGLLVK
jgi:hypothetical protein